MLRDISKWDRIGYGGKSTLEKEELRSPDKIDYLIKYPRDTKVGVSWEDITELVAAEIGSILGFETMDVEIVIRNGRRGCLLRNFVRIPEPVPNEEGGVLLSSFDEYQILQATSSLKGNDLIDYGFTLMNKLPYWEKIERKFLEMQFFDIIIGNQDRHPYNWMLMFYSPTDVRLSPIYDNGASLGFRFDDEKLIEVISNEAKLNKYTKNTKVKAGLFERKKVKAKEVVDYLLRNYPIESKEIIENIVQFDLMSYNAYIQGLPILTNSQKEWLMNH
ncbi:HipA domain-containing protein [Virgibacillus byunsanensis]|uniref:HipA domain-containing protein n=1 Tax=Virgibacillus byunsanensis TaxID=570945 RepID=A0ABW3LGN4_9BACI